jgi:hypothetical protein
LLAFCSNQEMDASTSFLLFVDMRMLLSVCARNGDEEARWVGMKAVEKKKKFVRGSNVKEETG